jgi:tetratricopeptide (TPR) repeat protein
MLHISRGRAYSDKRDFRNAIADYSETIRLSSRNTLAFWLRADVYEQIGEIQKAIADYERVLELSPGHDVATRALKRLRGR